MKLDDKLFLDRFLIDEDYAHLKIKNHELCKECDKKPCTFSCPTGVYHWDGERITVQYVDCVECGTCRIVCQEKDNIDWNYPRGGFGISYKFG